MHRDRRITVVVETGHPNGRPGTCKFCGARFVWLATAPHGQALPFNPNPLVLSEHENPDTRVKFKVLSSDSLHVVTCPNKPRRTETAPRTGAR
jgi:hypothetical protein